MSQPETILAVHCHAVGIAFILFSQLNKYTLIADCTGFAKIEGKYSSLGGVGMIQDPTVRTEGGTIGMV